jgi:hypothetical protein
MSRVKPGIAFPLFLVAFFLAPCSLLFSGDAKTQYLGQFMGNSYIEVEGSQGLFNLNKDFTIEMWVSWQPTGRSEYFAGDEAWPGMSDQIKVQGNCGWVLRKLAREKYEVLDFTFGCKEQGWVNVKGKYQKTTDAVHLVVSRYRDVIALIANGQIVAQQNVKGLTILPAPTPIYLGPRKHGHRRTLNGTIGFFRMANVAHYRKAPFRPKLVEEPDKNDLVFYDFREIDDGKLIDLSAESRDGVTKAAHDGISHNVKFTSE